MRNGLLLLLAFLLLPCTTLANGGTIQLASEPVGEYLLTVFTSPNPIRVGVADVSILVQGPGEEVVGEVRVWVRATPIGREGEEIGYEATHELATNKLYYAAHVDFPAEGRWLIRVDVEGEKGEGTVDFQVEVFQASLLDTPLALVALFALPLLMAGVLWTLAKRRAASPVS